ncbi:MAG TPA: FecR family protein [Myxococcaceae bacterium]|nr:FecR family protein [Myxococcaceae bacterium]
MQRAELRLRVTALAIALGGLALLGCGEESAPPAPIASLISSQRPAHLERAGARLDAAPGAPLLSGDVVATGPGGSAVIRYADGTRIVVHENTRFRLGGTRGRLTLELEEGSLVSDARTTGGELRLITRYGAAEILRGSEVQFTLSGEGGSLEVAFGEIRLVGGDGGASSVIAGQELAFDLSGRIATAREGGGADAGSAAATQALRWSFGAQKGAASVRAPGEKRFSPASELPAAVSAGTEFEVHRLHSARLAGEGFDLEVDGSARGAVGEATRQGAADRFDLALAEGGGLLRWPGDRERTLTLSGGASLHAREEAAVQIRQTRRGTEVSLLAGRIDVSNGAGEVRSLNPGERAQISATGIEVYEAAQPSLVVPHSRRVRIYGARLGSVGLAVPTADPSPRVEVARNDRFEAPFLAGRAHGEFLVIEPPKRGDVYWRALDGTGAVLARGHARFDRDTARSAELDNPHAEVAETGLKASVFFQSAPPAITFSFAPREGARSYRVRVYRSTDLKNAVAEKIVTEPRCAFEAGRLPDGDYLWYAAPVDANGTELAGGRMNRLEIVYDNSRTTLAIARPRVGEIPTGEVTPVRGVAPLGSKLYVNGKPAALDSKGRFSLDLHRADAVVFRLVADNGSESWWIRSLRRGR